MRRITLKEAQRIVREWRMVLTHNYGEYRVNFRGGSEATAYYADDVDDAINTARAMRAQPVCVAAGSAP